MTKPPTETQEPRAPDVFAWAVDELSTSDIPTATGDAEIILGHALGITRADVQAGKADTVVLTEEQLAVVTSFVERRKLREPLQHLTGKSFFRTLTLAVGPGVFVPRRETEYVAELAIRALRTKHADSPIAVDLGMGAGAIALSMAIEVPHSTVYGVELSPAAFEWARKNFERIAPGNSHAVQGDIGDALHELDGQVDVVAGNPPWLPDGVAPVTPEVALWDPPVVSWAGGGPDGMNLMRAFSKTALRLMRPGGSLVTEHGISQAPAVRAILEADGWLDIASHIDPRGKERVTTATRP